MTLEGGLFSEIYSYESSLYDFWILVFLRVIFFGNFWILKTFENYFEMSVTVGGGYLVKFIHLIAPYMIVGF